MRAFRWDRVRLAGRQPHLFLRVLKENADRSYQDVKCVLDIVVVVPRHFLLWADLQLSDPKSRSCGVIGAPLHLVQSARILYRLHALSSLRGKNRVTAARRDENSSPSSFSL